MLRAGVCESTAKGVGGTERDDEADIDGRWM